MFIFVDNAQFFIEEETGMGFYPTHVVGKEYQFIPVINGLPIDDETEEPSTELYEDGIYGVFVHEDDYSKIDHNQPYIFFHDIYVEEGFESEEEKIAFIEKMRHDMENGLIQ